MSVAFLMSCSFTNQVLAELDVLENRKATEHISDEHLLPKELDCENVRPCIRCEAHCKVQLSVDAPYERPKKPQFGARDSDLMSTEIQECIAATDIAMAGTVFT